MDKPYGPEISLHQNMSVWGQNCIGKRINIHYLFIIVTSKSLFIWPTNTF